MHTLSDLLVHVLRDLDVRDGGGIVAEHVHVRVHDAHVLRAVAGFGERCCREKLARYIVLERCGAMYACI